VTIQCVSCGHHRPHKGRGWCTRCYSRWLYHGKPADGPPTSRLTGQDELDHAAVHRATTGDHPPPLTIAEQRAAAQILRRRGLAYQTIATRLQCHPYAAWRYARPQETR